MINYLHYGDLIDILYHNIDKLPNSSSKKQIIHILNKYSINSKFATDTIQSYISEY